VGANSVRGHFCWWMWLKLLCCQGKGFELAWGFKFDEFLRLDFADRKKFWRIIFMLINFLTAFLTRWYSMAR